MSTGMLYWRNLKGWGQLFIYALIMKATEKQEGYQITLEERVNRVIINTVK